MFWSDRAGKVASVSGVVCAAVFLGIGGAVSLANSTTEHDDSPQAGAGFTPVGSKGLTSINGNIEVALMLDVTRSMTGDKLADLKAAAKDLVDRVVLDDQTSYASRVALVPFAQTVRLPEAAYRRAVGQTAEASKAPVAFTQKVRKWHWYYGWQSVAQTYTTTNCVAERMGLEAFTDTAPGPNAYATGIVRPGTSAKCGQPSNNTMIPLTSNKKVLDAAIDQLKASSEGAAGHVGAAWAWYALSPKWNNVWASSAHHASAHGARATRKIAILMSDGAFDTQYTKQGMTGTLSQAPNGSSTVQTRQLCTAMKASGVIVYTVGLDLGPHTSIAKTLTECATDASKALRVQGSKALKPTFKAIAEDITKSDLSS